MTSWKISLYNFPMFCNLKAINYCPACHHLQHWTVCNPQYACGDGLAAVGMHALTGLSSAASLPTHCRLYCSAHTCTPRPFLLVNMGHLPHEKFIGVMKVHSACHLHCHGTLVCTYVHTRVPWDQSSELTVC